MEEGGSDGWALSNIQQRLRMILARSKRLEVAGGRWWKYLLLGLFVASCSYLFLVSSSSFSDHHYQLPISVILLPSNSRPSVVERRLLIAEVGDYASVETTAEVETKNAEKIAAELREVAKQAEDKSFLEKVANGDEDYENVALKKGIGNAETDSEQVQVEDGIETFERTEGIDDVGDLGEQRKTEEDEHSKSELSGVEKFLDRLEETLSNDEDGRFNKTISEKDGVLETVARVGGHSFDEEEDEDVSEHGKDTLGGTVNPEWTSDVRIESDQNAGNETHNSTDPGEADVTWLDRIMGQSDQPHKPEPSPVAKEGRNHSVVAQKKNVTREKLAEENAGYHQVDDVPRLIDREDNTYVISNPKNKMILQEDLTLISDVVIVIVAAALGGTICGLLGQPVILGYLVAGMLVGPGGLHLVHELVQVETLAQFGVVFLLFILGVEFNPSKMQGIHSVTLGGGCLQIGSAMLLGGLLGSSIPQGVFIGAFLSMSSTAVVVKCLMDSKMGGTEHGQIMLGTLILQDCALGLLLAVMPALAAKGSDGGTFVFALSRAAVLLFVFCGCAWVLAKLFIPRFLRFLVQLTKFNSELFLLGAIGICLSFALLSQCLGLSLEVGAFVGGLVLSGGAHTEKTLHQVEPIRNVFAALFLSSIGMVMHPVFLWEHIDILMASLGVVFLGKTCLFAIVVRMFGYNGKISLSVGIALAQIGEFAFILLSRAQGLGLVSRKLYLLLMGTSALSLVLTPFAFKIVIGLNPSGKIVARTIQMQEVHAQQGANLGFPSLSGPEKEVGPAYWSLAEPGDAPGDHVGDVSVQSLLSSELNAHGDLVESIDMEDGRGERPSSPVGVTLRRPYNMSGKWSVWRNESDGPESYEQRR